MNLLASCLIFIFLVVFYICRFDWPTGTKQIKEIENSYRNTIQDLKNAEIMLLKLKTFANFLLVNPLAIKKMILILNDHYFLFKNENHQLQFTVLSQIEILAHYELKVAKESLLPHPKLEENLDLVVSVINKR